jgi:chromosome segregation ATPase
MCSALLKASETYASLSDAVVKKILNETEQTRAKLDKDVEALHKQIQQRETQIAEQKKSIETRSSKAVALRMETTLARGVESQKKLEQALDIESEINKTRDAMQKLEGELVPLRAARKSLNIRRDEAQTKITALKDIQAQRARGVAEIAQTIEPRKTEFTRACKDVIAAAAEVDGLSRQALDQAQKALVSLNNANNAVEGAVKLLDEDKKRASWSEWAHVNASEGVVQRSMLSFRSLLKDSSNRLARVWETLHDDKPSQPRSEGVSAFLEASNRAQEMALESYAKAIGHWEQAVLATPQNDNWQYKREYVVGLLDYAALLDLAGQGAEAENRRKTALDTFAEIETAADKAKKPRSIVALKKFVLEKTGS